MSSSPLSLLGNRLPPSPTSNFHCSLIGQNLVTWPRELGKGNLSARKEKKKRLERKKDEEILGSI